jgi:hypothetical protein
MHVLLLPQCMQLASNAASFVGASDVTTAVLLLHCRIP